MHKALPVAAALAVCALAALPTQAATLTTKGRGWKLTTQLRVTSLSPGRQYTITFATSAMKTRYTPYLTAAVSQAKAAGLKLAIGGVEPVNPAKCGPVGHIQFTELYRPLGRAGYSQGMPCPNPSKGVGTGGIVAIDSEYWDGTWPIPAYKLRNTLVHEPLHALGLDHPNLDLNKDGKTADYECVAAPSGETPIMCSPNGGYRTAPGTGRLTGFDLDGLKALLANARAQGIK
ncbi:hypothetical protein NCG97_30625 [Streptomyces lydicamycinicus]|uniref:hypothetical protein n=1 Tax=Streptomyces lydicamycinicus TaxID=1546107 RepID=UPI0020361AC3|nr:hypothetical protein [Streptomyces lydicamycinicus]USA03979.1 hypothetical protein NCG97_30625 [Streptomyces lydicamycinicus]